MNTKIQFLHLRRPSVTLSTSGLVIERAGPYGGVTVAYVPFEDGVWHVAFARCRNDERYNKKLGREVAIANIATTMKAVKIECGPEENPLEQIAQLVYANSAMRKNLRAAVRNTTGVIK